MPTYVYQCEKCEEVFDVRASIKEKEQGLHPECPECHGKKTRQVLTAGVVIHGSDGASLSTLPTCGPNCGPGCCG